MMNRLPMELKGQKRFFFGGGGGGDAGFNPTANPFSVFYRTTVSTATSTSFIATPVFVSCIPTTQFAANAAGVTCPQKKRHARQLLRDISPSEMESLEPTEVTLMSERRPFYDVGPSFVETDGHLRQDRAFFNYAVTLTTTTTVYQFNATTVKRTVAPAASASGLSCLPAGFVLC